MKELAEDFQIVNNTFQNLIDEMVELNMPHKPNPFQNWYEVDLKIEKNDNAGLPNSTSAPKLALDYMSKNKTLTKTVKISEILKQTKTYQSIVKNLRSISKKADKSKPKSKNEIKGINEYIIKRAIEGKSILS